MTESKNKPIVPAGLPTSKGKLIHEMLEAHAQFEHALAKLDEEDLLTPDAWGSWSIKDLLAHITDWEVRTLGWYTAGLRGEIPQTPDPAFAWEQMDGLNHAIYLSHRDEPLPVVEANFARSWAEVQRLIEGMTEAELFETHQYAWLGEYIWADVMLGSTTHHYHGHLKDLQAWLDSLRG